jgi:hypothetical protein
LSTLLGSPLFLFTSAPPLSAAEVVYGKSGEEVQPKIRMGSVLKSLVSAGSEGEAKGHRADLKYVSTTLKGV